MSKFTIEEIEWKIKNLRDVFQGKMDHWARQSDQRPADYKLLGQLQSMGYVLMCLDVFIDDYFGDEE